MKNQTLRILVGDSVQLQKVGAATSERYASTVIGFVPGKSLLVSAPTVNDKSVLIREGQQFAVRMLQGSYIQAFVAKVLHNALAPYPYLHLSFPREVESIEVRNADRADTNIPVMTKNVKLPNEKENWKSAFFKDISSTGAKLESMSKIGEQDDELSIQLKLIICDQEEDLELHAAIKNMEEPKNVGADEWGVFVSGLQFVNPGRLEQVLIQNYVLEHRMSYEL
jgi:c-di-GMP-binding flagellar brake protein YcgR